MICRFGVQIPKETLVISAFEECANKQCTMSYTIGLPMATSGSVVTTELSITVMGISSMHTGQRWKNYCWHTVALPWRIAQESERNLRNPVQGWGHRASNACTWLLFEKNYENGQRTGSRWQEKVSQFNSESEAVANLFLWWESHRRTLRTPTQVFCFAKDWVIMYIILMTDRCLVAYLNRGRSLKNTRLNVTSDFQGIYTSVHGHVQYGT